MSGFKINADIIADYARQVEETADELEAATETVGGDTLTAESFGGLGEEVGLTESYVQAADALRRQLLDGSAALRSASEALHKVIEHHAGGDEDSAELIKRAGEV